MGLAARNHVQTKYSWQAISGRFDSLFKEICGREGKAEFLISRKMGNFLAIIIIAVGLIYVAKMIVDRLGKISDFIK
jgi:hypothetical protein